MNSALQPGNMNILSMYWKQPGVACIIDYRLFGNDIVNIFSSNGDAFVPVDFMTKCN